MMSWMCRIAFPIVDPDPGRRGELKMTSKWTSFAESSCLSGNCVENNIRVLYLGGGGGGGRRPEMGWRAESREGAELVVAPNML